MPGKKLSSLTCWKPISASPLAMMLPTNTPVGVCLSLLLISSAMPMFQKMGIADEIKSKLKQTPTGVFVGSIIASGEAEIGFQQVSELSFFPGIDYVGPIPAEVQLITVFSAGIPAGAKQAD